MKETVKLIGILVAIPVGLALGNIASEEIRELHKELKKKRKAEKAQA